MPWAQGVGRSNRRPDHWLIGCERFRTWG